MRQGFSRPIITFPKNTDYMNWYGCPNSKQMTRSKLKQRSISNNPRREDSRLLMQCLHNANRLRRKHINTDKKKTPMKLQGFTRYPASKHQTILTFREALETKPKLWNWSPPTQDQATWIKPRCFDLETYTTSSNLLDGLKRDNRNKDWSNQLKVSNNLDQNKSKTN